MSELTGALLSGLTAAQGRAATHVFGPMLVTAGPGAGKTRTLTTRLAYLLAEGHARPEELLAVTFTRKAAAEIRERLVGLLGDRAARIRVGTFHSIATLLRPPPGQVLSEGDRLALLRRSAEQAGVSLRSLQDALCRHKADPAAPLLAEGDRRALADGVLHYEALRRSLGAEDMDDLLLGALAALEAGATHPWRFVSIDEYQDTNAVQRRLSQALGGADRNVFAIGDPDQAIYSFRGGDARNFFAFPKDFSGAVEVDLRENFRSMEVIVSAAGAVIARNRREGRTPALPQRAGGTFIEIMDTHTEIAEGDRIAAEIERLLGGTSLSSYDSGRASAHEGTAYSFSDVAVLARSGARADALARGLARAGLPIERPRRSQLDSDAAQDLLAYLRFCADAQDGAALLRVLLREARPALLPLERSGRLAFDSLDEAVRAQLLTRRARLAPLPLAERIDAVAALLESPDAVRDAAQALLAKNGPAALLSDDGMSHESDELDPRAERIRVLTMHGAKGLEFSIVFVAGCEAQLLPGGGCDEAEIEEERRLFYVAMTRARDRLFLSWARRGPRGEGTPSPFLREVPASLLVAPKAAPTRKRAGQMKLF